MPLKINVGLSKKIGQPSFGSLGASCDIEFEAASGLLRDFDSFHHEVQSAFAACRQAVQVELSRAAGNHPDRPANTDPHSSGNGDGSTALSPGPPSPGEPTAAEPSGAVEPRLIEPIAANGASQSHRNGRRATVSQIRAIHRMADRLQLNLTEWLQRNFNLGAAEQLSVGEASQTIDAFQSQISNHGHGCPR